MFIILLRFSHNKEQAAVFMQGHNQWIQQGMLDKVFLVVGSLQPGAGGAIMAYGESREALEHRIKSDPFENIVTAEILEMDPKMADERLQFLLDDTGSLS